MAYLTQVGTTTTANTNLNTATLVHTQTNTTRIRELFVNVFADQVKGNGNYIVYITIQRAGAGSFYESIKTTKTAAAGITAQHFSSIPITLNATDVMKVYLLGLATDNDGTADVIVDVNEALPAVAGDQMDLINAPNGTAVTAIQSGLSTLAKLTKYIQLITRKDAAIATDNVTELTAINASGGSGAGAFSNLTDSEEAIRDNELAAGAQMDLVNAPNGTAITAINLTPLARIGAFTGTGINTILGFLRALANKAAGISTPTDLSTGGTFTNTTDSLEAILDTGPSAAAIDSQLSGVHGAGAWGPIGSTGSFTITITVTDSVTGNPLQDVLVTTKDSTDVATGDQKRTNASGVVQVALNAGTYKIHLSSIPGYSSAVNTLIVAANASVSYTVAPIVIGTPSTPNLCRIYGYEYLNGNPVVGSRVSVQLISLPQTTTTVILEGPSIEAVSDINGLWYADLVIGKTYNFTISQAGVDVNLLVPNQVTYDLRSAV
jgi:hypothetical protein